MSCWRTPRGRLQMQTCILQCIMMNYLSVTSTHSSELSFTTEQIPTECNIGSSINKSTQEFKLTNFTWCIIGHVPKRKQNCTVKPFMFLVFTLILKCLLVHWSGQFGKWKSIRKVITLTASLISRKKTQKPMWNDKAWSYNFHLNHSLGKNQGFIFGPLFRLVEFFF